MVYLPQEDSHLLKKWVEQLAKGNVLDMGTGSGIQAFAALPNAKKIVAVDADPNAVEYIKNALIFEATSKIEVRRGNLFDAVKPKEKFDVMIFNPPYLPESKYDKEIDTTGGKNGWETIEKFLKGAGKHLEKDGIILMVFSSLTNKDKVLEIAKAEGYKPHLLQKKHVSFEDLFVYKFTLV
ncbi:MAG TPA: methyltransferase domain-containing protein [Candidatus Woesearchaeota archaeon]|nr:methyltransferase domain-containing protein [Candidatus Woesearchaeota archaeon]